MFCAEIPFLHKADLVISVSEHNARLLERFYRIPKARLSVLHNWVDTDFFGPSRQRRDEGRKKLGLAPGQVCFLVTGSLWRPKGFHVAIKAFKLLAERAPDTVLILAGSGPEEKALKALSGPGLINNGRIKFLGEIALAELPSVYNSADIFLMPSIHPEGLAYTLIEAMACGLPAIATTLGGNIETLGDCGILIKPSKPEDLSSCMLDLALNPGKRSAMGTQAAERALRLFSIDMAREKVNGLLDYRRLPEKN
ncbi:MAG: glycosyltransferase family 4 protein [Elusimicrobiales bacterium]|nr:glycosyltransferase family 4 protein [Elusimicrobiales bacterium]